MGEPERDDREPDSEKVPPPDPAWPPPSPEETARRNAIIAAPETRALLLKSLEKCAKKHREEIVQQGCTDALADPEFPVDEALVLPFLLRKTDNARQRHYHALRRAKVTGREVRIRGLGSPGGEPLSPELERVSEAAENVALHDATSAQTLAMMKDHYLADMEVRDIARKYGTTEDAYYKATKRLRARVLALMGIAVILLALLVFRPRPPQATDGTIAHDVPGPVPTSPVDLPPAPTDALVAKLVADGEAACDRQEWRLCIAKLEEASTRDPSVTRDPRFQAARRAASQAIVTPAPSASPPDNAPNDSSKGAPTKRPTPPKPGQNKP
jgi:hypothetical protein